MPQPSPSDLLPLRLTGNENAEPSESGATGNGITDGNKGRYVRMYRGRPVVAGLEVRATVLRRVYAGSTVK